MNRVLPENRVLLFGSLVLPLLAALLLALFAWPAVRSGPHGLPVGAVAPQGLRENFPALLDRLSPGGFSVRFYEGVEEAQAALKRREVYGVFFVDPAAQAFRVYLASAASPQVAQLLRQIAEVLGSLPAPMGFGRPEVLDLVPARPEDPRQAGLGASGLPLLLGGVLGGVLLGLGLSSRGARLLGALLFPLLTGFAVAWVLHAYGTLGGSLGTNALAAALAVAAIQLFVGGMAAQLGVRGLALAVLTFFLTNPFAPLAGAPEMLPSPWGTFGLLFPLGAYGVLMRSVAFFGGAGAGVALGALSFWALVGLGLLLWSKK
ncbi:hypothetical protein [Thermus filiformis]|jgi:hypothetical protein|uniref:Uncharacterized protein n=1 Tax=Thermus filiformis TaxID=276 RepID=A0A0A2XCV0_THEFI|nr:hypothetical protein [Thermus filiformis]KGQ22999.1 hypothetical protein THFILI_11140 [Thermus filiformis]